MSRPFVRRVRFAPTLLAVALGLGAGSCAHAPTGGAVAFRVEANVPDAAVLIDDVLVGKAADWARDGRHVRAGFHRVEIRAPGFYSVYQEIEQPDGGSVAIKADLHPLLE
jgi:hypothetical protein